MNCPNNDKQQQGIATNYIALHKQNSQPEMVMQRAALELRVTDAAIKIQLEYIQQAFSQQDHHRALALATHLEKQLQQTINDITQPLDGLSNNGAYTQQNRQEEAASYYQSLATLKHLMGMIHTQMGSTASAILAFNTALVAHNSLPILSMLSMNRSHQLFSTTCYMQLADAHALQQDHANVLANGAASLNHFYRLHPEEITEQDALHLFYCFDIALKSATLLFPSLPKHKKPDTLLFPSLFQNKKEEFLRPYLSLMAHPVLARFRSSNNIHALLCLAEGHRQVAQLCLLANNNEHAINQYHSMLGVYQQIESMNIPLPVTNLRNRAYAYACLGAIYSGIATKDYYKKAMTDFNSIKNREGSLSEEDTAKLNMCKECLSAAIEKQKRDILRSRNASKQSQARKNGTLFQAAAAQPTLPAPPANCTLQPEQPVTTPKRPFSSEDESPLLTLSLLSGLNSPLSTPLPSPKKSPCSPRVKRSAIEAEDRVALPTVRC